VSAWAGERALLLHRPGVVAGRGWSSDRGQCCSASDRWCSTAGRCCSTVDRCRIAAGRCCIAAGNPCSTAGCVPGSCAPEDGRS